ncbi:hypothetical protein K504DRAFT_453711 [Pleomassaria siparia CBS 279.74]|uniref:Amidase signature enzyme n=1 Tax=Pleomassaria siparia CBS 279.74 TaxID=1314801 RepID=A0A6G1KGG5_9PLEO|nr:hypothetical protein K504DRAFT_453711 [Pleomassaria siparia CBS 279.74]
MKTVIAHESTRVIPDYLKTLENCPQTVKEIVKYNEEHAEVELPEALLLSTINNSRTDAESEKAKSDPRAIALDNALETALKQYSIDAIIALMYSPITTIAACSSGPIRTVPLGPLNINGRLFGLGIIARPGEEATVLKVMSAFEATFPARSLPSLLNRGGSYL